MSEHNHVITRISLVGTKLGMTQRFDLETGVAIPLTAVLVEKNYVLGVRTKEKDGYQAIVVAGGGKKKNIKKPQAKQFETAESPLQRCIYEIRLPEESHVKAEWFAEQKQFAIGEYLVGQIIDVTGTSKGKGFAGVMKRWNFGGLEASHGVSVSHRSHGSTGQRQDPGRVFKGKKMAGHMGDERITVKNLVIDSIEEETGVVYIVGAVPGGKNSLVFINDAINLRAKNTTFDVINNVKVPA